MSSIIPFKTPSDYRKEFIFQTKKVRITTKENKVLDYPCIVMYHRSSMVPAAYPGYERWLINMRKAEEQKTVTLKKKAVNLCSFLNFILWNTNCDAVTDISLADLREFFIHYKEVSEGCPRDPQEWARGITDVMMFMRNYVVHNMDRMEFKVSPDDLITPVKLTRKGKKRTIVAEKASKLYVRPPKKTHRKYRLLLHGHLNLFIYEAKKYDPMILPGIMLQAYAGLREGEVVNCTTSNIQPIAGGFGRIREVIVDLNEPAGFASSYTGKTGFGSIKVPRSQKVYSDFVEKFMSALDAHERYLCICGYPLDDGRPLFYNKWGSPMSVSTYTGRIRKLFYEHFLPDLRKICEAQGTWAENAPYIEAYEREYPGAHMFRHWFTMYLLQYTALKPEEVSHLRGDSDIESMKDYIHVNQRFITVFKDAVFTAQKGLLEEIL